MRPRWLGESGKSIFAASDSEISDLMTEIVRLQRQVGALTAVVQHLYTLTGTVNRFTDQQMTAYDEIPELLEHIRNPGV